MQVLLLHESKVLLTSLVDYAGGGGWPGPARRQVNAKGYSGKFMRRRGMDLVYAIQPEYFI